MIQYYTNLKPFESLSRFLDELSTQVITKCMRKALWDGASVVETIMRANVPVYAGRKTRSHIPGFLRSQVQRWRFTHNGTPAVGIGFKAKWFTGQTFYAAFADRGHSIAQRISGTTGKGRHKFVTGGFGRTTPAEFMKRTWVQSHAAASYVINTVFSNEISRVWAAQRFGGVR